MSTRNGINVFNKIIDLCKNLLNSKQKVRVIAVISGGHTKYNTYITQNSMDLKSFI